MNNKKSVLLGVSFVLFALLFLLYPGSAVTSSLGNFTVSPDAVYVNWTSGVINITSIAANDTFYHIWNTTEALSSQYFSGGIYNSDGSTYSNYNSSSWFYCFSGIKFMAQNASSGAYTNVTDLINISVPTLYNIIAYQFCPPGLYNGTFNVTKNGTLTDYANITASIIIPVSAANTFSEAGSNAFARGTIPENSTAIHKYYFNTSFAQTQNLTSVRINLSCLSSCGSQDMDLYLFNAADSLLTKSAESGYDEEIYRNLPSASEIWQLWVVGNVTPSFTYQANMSFSTINVTNASNTLQQITSLDFGELTPVNSQSAQFNITLANIDGREWSNAMEKGELYRTESWTLKNTTGDYYFLVPHFATKVKVKIEWKGGTRWTIALNSTNAFMGNSSRKYQTGNLTNTAQEESVIYAGSVSESNDGLWKITVGNITATGDDKYNVTAQVWYNYSYWLSSGYPAAGFNFTSAGSENATKNISLRVTLPGANITNGTYSGFVGYYRANEWVTRIPVSFTVRSGTLLVNNSLYSVTETKHDNVGFNRAGDGLIWVNLTLSNIGNADIYFVNTTNYTLSLDSTHNMSFDVQWPSNPIASGASKTINISISINTSRTQNYQGLYYGDIIFNTTNSTNSSSVSYPFDVSYVRLYVNLTDVVVVNVTGISPTLVASPLSPTNMTFNVTATLANGSVISGGNMINQSDFTNIRIIESNSTLNTTNLASYGPSNTSDPKWQNVCPSGEVHCRINATLERGPPGGTYYAYVTAYVNTTKLGGAVDSQLIGGTGRGAIPVTINDVGLRINHLDEAVDENEFNNGNYFYETNISYYTANITNLGPVAATDALVILKKDPSDSECSAISTIVRQTSAACSELDSGLSSSIFNVSLSEFYTNTTTCWLKWRITAASVAADMDCDLIVGFMTNQSNYGNYTGFTITVKDKSAATTGEDDDGNAAGQTQTCTSNVTCSDTQYCKNSVCTNLVCQSGYTASGHKCVPKAGSLEVTNYTAKVYVVQGSSNTTKVTVKNTGGYTYTVKLNATAATEGITASATPASYSLSSGNSGIYTVTLSATEAVEVGYHTVTLKAYASENASVYVTKDITLAVEPAEGEKAEINKTRDDLKELFVSVTALFNQLPPVQDANYTLANRTYTRILNMFQDVENSINTGNYLEANSLLKDINASIAEFRLQISQLGGGGLGALFSGETGMLTLIAIIVVVVVIIGFLAYLMIPSKKGYHPALGYVPHEKVSISHRITHIFSKIKIPKLSGRQRSLGDFGARAAPAVQPAPSVATQKPETTQPEKKVYMDGYHRLDQFSLSYDKNKLKEKK